MKALNFSYRVLLHVIGYLIIALGVVLIYRAEQGAYPIDAVSYYLNELIPGIDLGIASIIINGAWVILNFILIRKWQTLGSFIIVFTFGYLINLWDWIIPANLTQYGLLLQIPLALSGLVLLGAGIALIMFNARFPLTPSEVCFLFVNEKVNSTVKTKLIIEVTMITIAITLAAIAGQFSQIGWLTIASVLTIGFIISFFQKIFKKFITVY